MGKVKAPNGKAKHADPLTSVKSGSVTKPSNSPLTKAKIIAQSVPSRLKRRKTAQADESSSEDDSEDGGEDNSENESEADSESADDSEDSDSDEEEESDAEKTKAAPVMNGKAKKSAAAAVKADSSDSDDESEDEAHVATNGANGHADDAATSDSSDSSENEDEQPAKKTNEVKLDGKSKKPKVNTSEDGSEDDSEDSEDSDDSEEDSEESDAEEETKKEEAKPSKKRKPEEEAVDEPFNKKAKAETSERGSTLFVGNLGWGVDDNVLYEEFKLFEDLLSARVITDKNTGRSRGFGYVDFANPEAAQKAYDEKNGAFVDGRDMRLDFAQKRDNNDGGRNPTQARAQKFGDVVSPESDTLFVGNLPFDADEDAVGEFFSEVCEVKSLRLPTDQESGQRKGFGYVTFMSVDDAKSVFQAKNGGQLNGRSVRLDYAAARPPRDNNGGGGFGGRGGGGGGYGGGGGFRGGRGGRGGGRGGPRGGGRGGFNSGGRGGGFQGKRITF